MKKDYWIKVFTVGLLGLLPGFIPLKVTAASAETTDTATGKPETSNDVVADSKIANDSISLTQTADREIDCW